MVSFLKLNNKLINTQFIISIQTHPEDNILYLYFFENSRNYTKLSLETNDDDDYHKVIHFMKNANDSFLKLADSIINIQCISTIINEKSCLYINIICMNDNYGFSICANGNPTDYKTVIDFMDSFEKY